jgi:sugar lactone lactonase YvrE
MLLNMFFPMVAKAVLPVQQAYQFASPVSLGAAAETGIVTVSISGAGSISSINVLTQGIPNQDYTFAAGGSCTAGMSYLVGQTCTVAVGFQPKYPGTRQGAVVLLASNGSVIGSELLYATCMGAIVVMVPAQVNTIAGDGSWIYQGDGMWALYASLYLPMGGAVDAAGNIFISDSNNQRIRRVDGNTQLISTSVGDGIAGFGGDGGPATSAMLNVPTDVKLDGAGNLYIADSVNNVVRMVNAATGIIQTIAGIGGQAGYSGDGGPATQALLSNPGGLAFDGNHTLYISDSFNNAIRKLDLSTGIITTVVGTGIAGFSGDGGPATLGQLNNPWGIALGNDGSLFIADLSNNRIRKVSPTGILSTIAGNGTIGFSGANGPATAAQLNVPAGVAVDVAGNVFIADSGNGLVREVDVSTGVILTHSGNATRYSDGTSASVNRLIFDGPYALFFDGPGNLYVSDMFHQMVKMLTAASVTISFAGIKIGNVSPPYPVIIEDDGNEALDLSAFQTVYSALDPATTTCQVSQPLGIGASCTMGVEAAPTALGNYIYGTLVAQSNAGNSPSLVTLQIPALSGDPTLAALTTSLNPAGVGAVVTFTATVTTIGASPPTGTVSFLDGKIQIGTATLNTSSVAVFSTATLGAGTHSITAVYSGDEENATATSPALTELIEQSTTTTITSNPNPSMDGISVTFTAVVTEPSGSSVIPSGTVAFYDGSLALGAGSLNASGIATFSISSLCAGTHNITAKYAGDTNSLVSQSAVVIQTVTQMATKTSLATSNANIYAGVSVIFTAVVSRTDSIIPTGVVTFLDGNISLGAAMLDLTGTAVWTAAGLAAGTHSISAVYGGDTNNLVSTSSILTEIVQQISTSTTLAASADPGSAGAVIQFTATVSASGANGNPPGTGSPNGGTFSGIVTFKDGATLLGTANVSATGIATLNISTLNVSGHNITAIYGGCTNYVGSASTSLLETITSATTSTVLTSGLIPSIAGKPVVLTATVTGNGGIPTGTVTLIDSMSAGGTSLGTGTTNANGIVSFTTSNLAVGQHTLTAVYSGDPKDNASTSAPLVQTIQIATTSTNLISSVNPSAFGANVTFTANITTNGVAATGTVTFSDGVTVLVTAPVNGENAVLNTSTLALGSHSITAAYGGDANNADSITPALSQQVRQAGKVTLSSSANPSIADTNIVFTATIAASQGVAVTGTVSFTDGGNVLGIGSVNAAGVATFSISSLVVGQHLIVATYSGDSNNLVGSSSTLVQTVQTSDTSVTLISSANPSLANAPVTLTATVVGKGESLTGVVTFQDGTTTLGATNVNAGVATFLVASLSPGLHSIIAVYGGDENNSQSSSLVLSQSVVETSTVTLASSQNPSLALDPVTFTARVSNSSSIPPSGTVVFGDGTATLGNATIDTTGTATFTAASMIAGHHTISAAYSGDAINLPGRSAVLTQSVQLRPTTSGLTASTTSLSGGQQMTLILVVHFSGPVLPTGTVTFMSSSQTLGTAALDNTGVAILSLNLLTSVPTVIASYSGDSVYATSTSEQTSVTVAEPTQFITMQMNPTSVTLQSKQHSTATLTVTSLNNFTDSLDLGCAGLPFAATCKFTNNQITLGADGVQVVQVVVDTGSPLTAGSQAKLELHSAGSLASMCFLPAGTLFGLLFWKGRRRMRSGFVGLLMMLLMAGLSTGLSGCSGLQINGTPPGTYVFQVTATGGSTGVMQTVSMTLTVTQ